MKIFVFIGICFFVTLDIANGRLLFKYMAKNGDTEITDCEDCFRYVALNGNYRYFEESYDFIYLTDVGSLYFSTNYFSTRIVPFYGHFFVGETYVLADRLHSDHMWYRESTNPGDLKKAKKIIKRNFGVCGKGFVPTHALIVTYQRLTSWCEYDHFYLQWLVWYYANYDANLRDVGDYEVDVEKRQDVTSPIPQNTLQAVLVTDGNDTYAIFNYHTIEWEKCPEYLYAEMEFDDGDDKYWIHPKTGKKKVGVALTTGTNVNRAGRWVYKISGENIQDPDCNNLT